jgi:hypothetical protein
MLPCPGLRVFEAEVNQGLAGYSLVAGKDTLVRVFVGLEAPLGPVAPLIIDRAELDVAPVFGSPLTLTDSVITNPITNIVQRYGETSNVNFYLPSLSPGSYTFAARLFHGTRLLKSVDLGKVYSVTATKDVRLLFVRPADIKESLFEHPVDGPTLVNVLATFSRVFPIRRGIGKIDTTTDGSGDKTSGLRTFEYLDGVDGVTLGAGGQLDAILYNFNAKLSIKGPPDCAYLIDLRRVLCVPSEVEPFDQADNVVGFFRSAGPPKCDPDLICPPGDYELGKSGGQAFMNAKASVLSIGKNGTDPGMILAQEVGHNYGLVDPSESNSNKDACDDDPNTPEIQCFHSKNFLVSDLTAFNLRLRKSIAPRALTTPPNPADYVSCPAAPLPNLFTAPTSVMSFGNHNECVLFETFDWEWLRDGLPVTSPITLPAEEAVFYIAGTINRDDTWQRLESRLWPPGSPIDPPVPGAYTIVFLDGRGQELASSGFNVSFDNTHGEPLASGHFSVARPFPEGTTKVQLRHGNALIAELLPSRNAPRVRLTSPRRADVVGQNADKINIRWSASDRDGDELTYTLAFSKDGGRTWLAIGSVFPPGTTSYVWDASLAPLTEDARVRVEASDGFNVTSSTSGQRGLIRGFEFSTMQGQMP